jgi:hypothetical protein
MKRPSMCLMAMALVFAFGVMPAFAQRGQGGATMSHGPSSAHGKSATQQSHSQGARGSAFTQSGKSATDLLAKNTQLAGKLEKILKLSGPDALAQLQADAQGFKNLGQFVAAVHVSNNLGIPFDQLKAKMTGDNAESLGKAVQELKPDADAKAEAKKANEQAKDDLNDSKTIS